MNRSLRPRPTLLHQLLRRKAQAYPLLMPHAKITFHELIQDSQDYGSNDEHMVSRVFFDLEFDGETKRGLYAHVKQPVGSSRNIPSRNIRADELQRPVQHAVLPAGRRAVLPRARRKPRERNPNLRCSYEHPHAEQLLSA